ncbi:MAG: CBS domain-containing protein [Desulfobacterales bacterium]|nr:CBS domain-containing protein [Desulfobacterales bacterium]MDX2513053.1 CBS domain-containing protein [Desulfobacterales bacterium]
MKIITTHRNADFDALASVIAVKIIFPDAIPVLPKQVNPNVKAFLSIHKDVFKTYTFQEVDLDLVDHLVVVDTNKWERLEGVASLKLKKDLDIQLWDHHPIHGNIRTSWMVSEVVGATITLLLRRIKEERHMLSPIQATLFLLGLYEDTGNLTFPSTTAEDAYAAAYLLERKADLAVAASFLRPAYGEKQKEILFSMLQNAERLRVKGHIVSISHIEIGGHVDSLAVVMRMYREILNVDAAVGIFSNNQKSTCMVIGRSQADEIDIGLVMQGLGGGGHPGAGSAMLKNSHPEVVREKILTLIQGNQPASVQISDIMSFPVVTALSGDTMEEVAFLLRKKGCTGVPVLENDELVGIISRRDFRKIKKTTQLKSPVKAYMSRKIVTIAPGRSPTQAAHLMVKHDVGRLPVVENGQVIGIVTRSDTMLYFYDQLPD